MHIIKSIHIEKFRAFQNLDILTDKNVVAIAGQNGTQKTTLLGMLAQPFSLSSEDANLHNAKTVEGGRFCSQLNDKFKFAPPHDLPGNHLWSLNIHPDICAGKRFSCASMLRSKRQKTIRFWNADDPAHTKGKGFVHCPTVFQSLSRLYPWGELKGEKQDGFHLSDEETALYTEWHANILLTSDKIKAVHTLQRGAKASIGPETDTYAPKAMSAGQDNVGKIILAVISLRRLLDNANYHGGIIFIDELETTMFPAAQIKLLEYMFKWASDYKIQFFFTTHSETILHFLRTGRFQSEMEIVFLSRRDATIRAETGLEWPRMKANLEASAISENPAFPPKIRVYAEDEVAFLFVKRFLAPYLAKVELMGKITLSNSFYVELLKKRVPEFSSSIVILDGDSRHLAGLKRASYRNLLFLPGVETAPERLVYRFLKSLPEVDKFWDEETGGYNKQACFRDFPEERDCDMAKKWFATQKPFWGNKCIRLLKRYEELHTMEIAIFRKDFVRAFNYVASQYGYNPISHDEL